MSTVERNLVMVPSLRLSGVLQLSSASPYWLGMTMFRLQEFYESKHETIRGQRFSLETAMDLYANADGAFDYPDLWRGFNIPGAICDEFFARFYGDLSQKEAYLWELIRKNRPAGVANYYLIGTCERSGPGYVEHELAHAAFYLDPIYRETMVNHVVSLPVKDRERIVAYLTREGYAVDVHADEIQAYLSTNTMKESKKAFGIVPRSQPFRDYYAEYFKRPRV